jgi:hypothetical protein
MRWRLASRTTEGAIDDASGAGSQTGPRPRLRAWARFFRHLSQATWKPPQGSVIDGLIRAGQLPGEVHQIHGGATDGPGVLPATETDNVGNAWSASDGSQAKAPSAGDEDAWALQRLLRDPDYGGPSPQMPAFLRRAEAAASR